MIKAHNLIPLVKVTQFGNLKDKETTQDLIKHYNIKLYKIGVYSPIVEQRKVVVFVYMPFCMDVFVIV